MANRTARGLFLLLALTLGLSACFHKVQRAPLSATPPLTHTPTPTPIPPTDTPTSPPSSNTPTPTDSPTPVPPIICTITPVAPTPYTEAEPIGVGGTSGGGTNEICTTRENLGTVDPGTSVAVSGNLSHSGFVDLGGGVFNYDTVNDDFDGYRFTAGADGTITITLDCFTNGSDGQDFDVSLITDNCVSVLVSAATFASVETITYPVTAGTSYSLVVIGWTGAPNSPYRLTVSGP